MELKLENELSCDIIVEALVMVWRVHKNQVDLAGKNYMGHVFRVGYKFDDPLRQVLGLLHDVIEDSKEDLKEEIIEKFGEEIYKALVILSRKKDQPYNEYIREIAKYPLLAQIKKADIKDNMNPARLYELDETTQVRLTKKYTKALEILEGGEN